MDLRNVRIALIYGQSIEGCGVTRNGSEMQEWARKNNVTLDIYSYDERTYNRRKVHRLDFISFNEGDIPEIVRKLNTYDIVVFNSYPSNKFNAKAIVSFYENLVKKVTTIKMGFMHELNKTNIDKIPFVVGLMNQMDVIYNFSEETWFSKTISQVLPSKVLGQRVKKFTMWFNFEELEENYRDKYRLSDKQRKITYIGRWTTMKDPRRILDLAPLLKARDPNFKCELMGIERSIGAKYDIFDHPNALDMTGKKRPENPTGFVPVYGPYVRDEGMKHLAQSLFGASFYRMPKAPQDYGDRMEYAQIEIIAVGSLPVFDRHWGEHNHTSDGTRYIDIPYSALYSDREDLNGTVELLLGVANDETLQKRYRDTSYELVKREFNADTVLPQMFEYVLSIGKDEGKYETDDDLIREITGNEEYVKEVNKLKERGEIVVMGIRELTENILSVLDGKREREITRWRG